MRRPPAQPDRVTGRPPADAVTVLSAYLALLVGIPAVLVVPGGGAVARPAVLLGLAALGWVGVAVVVPTVRLPGGPQPLRWALLAWAAAVFASTVALAARIPTGAEVRAGDRGVVVVLSAVGVALLAAEGVRDRDRLDVLVRRLVLAGAVLAVVGVLQFAVGYDLAARLRVPGLVPAFAGDFVQVRSSFRRVAGTASHPIEFGVVCAMLLPLALHLAFVDPRGGRVRRFLPAALLGAAVPMSLSRSGTLALLVGLAVLIPAWPRALRRQALTAGVLFLVGVRLAVPGLLGTIRSLFTNLGNDPSTTGRTDDYAVIWPYLRDSPLVGRGMYTFFPEQYTTLDNQYLVSLLDVGLLGVVAILGLFVVGASLARGARRRTTDPVTRSLAQALAAAVVAAAVSFATYDALAFPMATGTLFVVLGCCGALQRLTPTPLPPAPPVPLRAARLPAAGRR